MISQVYRPSDGYATVPAVVRDNFLSLVGVSDKYIILQCSDGWRLYICDYRGDISAYRADYLSYTAVTGYGYTRNYYNIEPVSYSGDWEFDISASAYTISNIGYGASAVLPCYDGIVTWSVLIIACISLFRVVFPCLFRRKGCF